MAFLVGLSQSLAVIFVEIVNLIILLTNHSVLDVIMNFLALVIISEFDDYFFKTVAHEMYGKLISDGEIPIYNYDAEISKTAKIKGATTLEAAMLM